MIPKQNNFAYIDGANLHKGVESLNWQFDYKRFRIWLADKYEVKRAYLFLGMIPRYKDLYQYLIESGFILVFKEVVYGDDGKPKGNCDADLVVQAMKDACEKNFDSAILVSSDGDYAPLVKFLNEKQKMRAILSPYETKKCSVLLKRTGTKIYYIDEQRSVLEVQKEKTPNRDKTL